MCVGALSVPPPTLVRAFPSPVVLLHRCLVVGAFVHGLGNHDAIRGDPNLELLSTMQHVVEAHSTAVAAAGDEAQVARTLAAVDALQAGPEAVFAFAGTLYPPAHQLNR